jgi:hypothetical protein
MVVSVKPDSFTGMSLLSDGTLAEAIRGLAIDHAQAKIQNADLIDFTDSSGGTAAAAFAAMVVPTAAFDASSTDGAPVAGFNTNAAKFENAGAVIGEHLNNVRARIGLPLVSWAVGTIATKGTIPAQDLTLTGAQGTNAMDFATGTVAMKLMRSNMRKMIRAFNEVRAALGHSEISEASVTGDFTNDYALGDIATQANVDGDGTSSIDDTVMDTFLTALGTNLATLASGFNEMFAQGALSDLTDNSGGTSEGDALAALDLVSTPYQDVATASAPFAQANTENAKMENNFADLASRVNELCGLVDIDPLVDDTGGTANTTLEVIDDTLTAVDGTGANTMSAATADVTWPEMANNVATIVARVNLVCAFYGINVIADSSGGTVSPTRTLVALTDYAGVDNGAAATGVAVAEANAAFDRVTDAMATIAAKLNEITGVVEQVVQPLHVVAG